MYFHRIHRIGKEEKPKSWSIAILRGRETWKGGEFCSLNGSVDIGGQ